MSFLRALPLLGLVACGGPEPPEMPNPPPPYFAVPQFGSREVGVVGEAVQVHESIRQKPETANEVLARHNLTEATWDAMMFQVASDPKDSAAFVAAVGPAPETDLKNPESGAPITEATKEP